MDRLGRQQERKRAHRPAQLHEGALPPRGARFHAPPSSLREGGTPGQPLPCLGLKTPRPLATGLRCWLSLAPCLHPHARAQHQDSQPCVRTTSKPLSCLGGSTAKASLPTVPGAGGDSEGHQNREKRMVGLWVLTTSPHSHLFTCVLCPNHAQGSLHGRAQGPVRKAVGPSQKCGSK